MDGTRGRCRCACFGFTPLKQAREARGIFPIQIRSSSSSATILRARRADKERLYVCKSINGEDFRIKSAVKNDLKESSL